MFSFTTSWIPAAAASGERPRLAARPAIAASAAARSMVRVPPAKKSGFRYPSSRLASVTVGAVPPRP